jgi:hypothetical protein
MAKFILYNSGLRLEPYHSRIIWDRDHIRGVARDIPIIPNVVVLEHKSHWINLPIDPDSIETIPPDTEFLYKFNQEEYEEIISFYNRVLH